MTDLSLFTKMCIYKYDFKISNSIKGEDQLKIDPKHPRKNVLVTGHVIGSAGTVLKKIVVKHKGFAVFCTVFLFVTKL